MGKYSHIWSNEELLRTTVAACETIVDVMRTLGVTANNGNTGTLKVKCKQYGITLPANGASVGGRLTSAKRRRTREDIFIHGTKIVNGSILKKFMLAEGVAERCAIEECGQPPFRLGKPLTLQVDHEDGNRFNNEMSNLRLLCPNCHTQTDTYAGKRRRTATT